MAIKVDATAASGISSTIGKNTKSLDQLVGNIKDTPPQSRYDLTHPTLVPPDIKVFDDAERGGGGSAGEQRSTSKDGGYGQTGSGDAASTGETGGLASPAANTNEAADSREGTKGSSGLKAPAPSVIDESAPQSTAAAAASSAGARISGDAPSVGGSSYSNSAPTEITADNLVVSEAAGAGTVVGSLSAIDPDDGDTHSFEIVGNDGRFTILDGQIVVARNGALDHETAPEIILIVRVTDNAGNSFTAPLTIQVADVNETPFGLTVSTSPVSENLSGAVIGPVAASDPDRGDSLTYSVSDDRFEVVNGQLKLKDGFSLDHEAAPQVTLTVTVTDSGGLTASQTVTFAVNDVNEGPTLALTTNSIAENASGAQAGTASGSDPDAGDSLSYTVSDDRFEVVNGALKLKDGVSLDHEAEPQVTLTVTATDSGGLSASQTVTIAVDNVNEGPSLSLTTNAIDENAAGAQAGTASGSDPDAGDSLTYTVSDDRFEVVNGQLKLKDGFSLDHEAEPQVTVTVTVTDSGGLTASQTVAFAVGDINERPSLALTTNSIDENAAGAQAGTASGSDPDAGDSLAYTVSDDRFEVVNGQLKLKDGISLNHEAEPQVALTVTATDSGGLTASQTVTIKVNDVNEGPSLALTTNSIDENVTGAQAGMASGSDPDMGDSLTYTVSDDRFEVVNGALKLKDGVGLDRETEPQVTLTVTATDSGGLAASQTVTVDVNDVNEGPTLALTTNSIDENASGAQAGTASGSDPDAGDSLSYTVSDDRFEVVNGALKLKDGVSLDHEAEPQVTLTVTATDSGGLSASQTVTIDVKDSVEAPDLTVTGATGTEDRSIDLSGLIETATSGQAGALSFTIAGVPDGAMLSAGTEVEAGVWQLAPADLAGLSITPPANSDADFTLSVTASITGANGDVASTTQSLAVSLAADADAPSLTQSGVQGGDSEIVLRVSADSYRGDPNLRVTIDGQVIGNYRITADHDAGAWQEIRIVGDFGPNGPSQVSAAFTNDTYAGTHETDRNLWIDKITVNGTVYEAEGEGVVYDRGSGPDLPGQEGMYWAGKLIFDTSGNGGPVTVGALGAEDQPIALNLSAALADTDGSETLAIQIAGVPEGAALSAGTDQGGGVWMLAPGDLAGLTITPPANSHDDFTLTVTATSAEGENGDTATTTLALPVTVTPVNDAPLLSANASIPVNENAEGAVIATIAASDIDTGDVLAYAVSDSRFEVVDGQLKLKEGVSLDHEAEPQVTLTVTVTDSGGLTATQTVTFDVNDINEAPSLALTTNSIGENAAGAQAGAASGSDADAGDSLTYAVSDERFEVVNGQLKLKDGVSLDHEAEPQVTLTVTTTDSGGLTASQTVTIDVTDVNEAPIATAMQDQSAVAGGAFAFNAAPHFSDVDHGDTLTYSIEGPDWLSIDPATGAISGTPPAHMQLTALDSQGGLTQVPGSGVLQIDTSFFSSTAGYNNTIGYYIADANGTPIGGAVIETNTHQLGEHGTLVDLSNYPGAAALGFFLIPNGAANSNLADGDAVSFQQVDGVWTAFENGAALSGSGAAIYFSDATLNPDGIAHLTDNEARGNQNWEDLFQGGDQDHDDVNLNAKVSLIELVPDTDTAQVTVTATDQGGLIAQTGFSLAIGNGIPGLAAIQGGGFAFAAPQAPVEITLDPSAIAENVTGALGGTLAVLDLDSTAHSFTVSDSRFEVVNGALKLKDGVSLDFEAAPKIPVEITAIDGNGLSATRSFILDVSNVNEGPSLTVTASAFNENAAGAKVATLTGSDPDAGDSLSYSVSDSRFEVSNGALKLKEGVSLDFEATPEVNVTVTATDKGGLTASKTVSVTPTNVNEGPSLTVTASTFNENAAGAKVATLTASDPDAGDSLSYTVSDSRFEVANGALMLKQGVSLDFEATPQVNVTVTATDKGGLTASKTVSVTPTNVNEGPSLTVTASTFNENAAGAKVATLTGSDPDAGDTLTYTVSDSRFQVANGALKLKEGISLDFETTPQVNVTVTATDKGGLTASKTVTVTPTNVNEGPSLSVTASTFDENAAGAKVATLTASDPDAGDSLTYTVSDNRFEVANGALKLKEGVSLDFEATPQVNVTVTVTDKSGLTASKTVTVTPTNVNEGPSLSVTASAFNENAAGAKVATLTGSDPDAGDALTYTVSDSRFEVSNGALKLKEGVSLDFEATPQVNVTVTATDKGGLTASKIVTVTPTNVNEGPSLTVTASAFNENAAGAKVATLTASDPDAGDSLTYTVSDNRFEVASGALKLKEGVSLNYEAEPQISVTVTATDKGGLTASKTVAVTPANVNEAPVSIAIASQSAEAGERFTLGTARNFSDVDAGDKLTYSIEGPKWLTIDASTGAISGTPPAGKPIAIAFADGLADVPQGGVLVLNTNILSSYAGYSNSIGYYVADEKGNPIGGAVIETNAHETGETETVIDLSQYKGGVKIGLFLIPDGNTYNTVEDGDAVTFAYKDGGWIAYHNGSPLSGSGYPIYFSDKSLNADGFDHLQDSRSEGNMNWEDLPKGGDKNFSDVNMEASLSYHETSAGDYHVTVTATDTGGLNAKQSFTLTLTDPLSNDSAEKTPQGMTVMGTDKNDHISAPSAYADTIDGKDFNDHLWGGDGNDTIYGRDGNDMLYGDAGDDTLDGGAGNDGLQGGAGNDKLIGGEGNDKLEGGDGADRLFGGLGQDTLRGDAGDDKLYGEAGNDTLEGGAGNDILHGGTGSDVLRGGDGDDLFIFTVGDGSDKAYGGTGASWTDTLDLEGADFSMQTYGSDWTLNLTKGSILSQDGHGFSLSQDAHGVVSLDDGSQMQFFDIERIQA